MAPTDIKAYNSRKHNYKKASTDRCTRIISSIIGSHAFPGTITIHSVTEARLDDSSRLQDIADPTTALIYWIDGSYKCAGVNDVLGAGVAWQDEQKWHYASYSLGANTGNAQDAELFGISLALGLAVERVVVEGEAIELVRVFSDAQQVLDALANDNPNMLGPAGMKCWALRDVYEWADTLEKAGVKVELVWVKGHSQSMGNRVADEAAVKATKMQKESLGKGKRFLVRREDAPDDMKDADRDAVEEWL
ncbi:hypothetical protein BKA63DRAFT_582928 [Paraphoma chrysanthemicola]|nr:hypothetical protein BKA63DRAFT_582928 [Paraphoma chrysanthemicola]